MHFEDLEPTHSVCINVFLYVCVSVCICVLMCVCVCVCLSVTSTLSRKNWHVLIATLAILIDQFMLEIKCEINLGNYKKRSCKFFSHAWHVILIYFRFCNPRAVHCE